MNDVSPPEAVLSRREEAKALFRKAILDAAEQVFAERGFHVARISDVAKHARIGVGTVYNHFEQKEDLLRALLEERTARMLEHLTPRADDPAPFEQRLIVRLTRVLEYVEDHKGFFLLAMEYGVLGKGSVGGEAVAGCKNMRQIEKFRRAFRGLIEEGLAADALVPMDAHRLAWSLGGILRMFIFGALVDQQEPSLRGLAPTIARLFLHGAARRNEPPSTSITTELPAPHARPKPRAPTPSTKKHAPTKGSPARTTSRSRRSPR